MPFGSAIIKSSNNERAVALLPIRCFLMFKRFAGFVSSVNPSCTVLEFPALDSCTDGYLGKVLAINEFGIVYEYRGYDDGFYTLGILGDSTPCVNQMPF